MYSYSTDNLHYFEKFETLKEAKIRGFEDNPDYDTIWVGEVIEYTPYDFISIARILDQINENACDEVSEFAEDWLDKDWRDNNEGVVCELRDLLAEWVQKNAPITFWGVEDEECFNRADDNI